MSKGNQTIPETTDEKVALLHFLPVLKIHIQLETHVFVSQLKKDLQEVAQAEADIVNLEHKVDDLENRLGQQDVKGSGSPHGGSRESRRSPEHNSKM